GPLEVRISMNQNTAHIWFGAQHADTRAVLAETLPRLREMFAEAGLSLGHAGVSQEAPGQDAGRTLPLQRRLDEQLATQATTAPTEVSRPLSGLLDLYAWSSRAFCRRVSGFRHCASVHSRRSFGTSVRSMT